ncbi:MAG TPA: SDR family oxidoreductase [Gemmatimonadaceae bacterium]|nr:SDR family oxidoreductase [Gemmatimonadaceae bacterium]
MDLGIKGKVALVTASSRGLGRAVAEELAAEGANLLLCARNESTLGETAEAIRKSSSGVKVVSVVADISDPAAVERVWNSARDEFGRVDILVNNAGGPPAGPFEAHSPSAWTDAWRLTFESAVNMTRSVLPGMKQRLWGRIINITSIAVKQPVDGLILSNSVRAAVTGFARTLANEVATYGVTVNNVMPGYTLTDRIAHLAESNAARRGTTVESEIAGMESQIPMHRLGTPREFAAMVAFLASDRASYTTGASIPVDGGWIRSLL